MRAMRAGRQRRDPRGAAQTRCACFAGAVVGTLAAASSSAWRRSELSATCAAFWPLISMAPNVGPAFEREGAGGGEPRSMDPSKIKNGIHSIFYFYFSGWLVVGLTKESKSRLPSLLTHPREALRLGDLHARDDLHGVVSWSVGECAFKKTPQTTPQPPKNTPCPARSRACGPRPRPLHNSCLAPPSRGAPRRACRGAGGA